MKEIGKMISSNRLSLDQFFTMHPFSEHDKDLFYEALDGINFIEELYVINNKTYERIAEICSLLNNIYKNLFVVTGYRGCGKTNFIHLIKMIAENKISIPSFNDLRNAELMKAESEQEKAIINKRYDSSKNKIKSKLFGISDLLDSAIDNNELFPILQSKIAAKVDCINFDEDGLGKERPFSTKLYFNFKRKIEERLKNGTYYQVIEIIENFVNRNNDTIEETFIDIGFDTMKKFWNAIDELMHLLYDIDDLQFLLVELQKLTLEQLLFAYTIWSYAEIIIDNDDSAENKLLYLLDNIDIVADSDIDIFKNTMNGVWKYVWNMRNVFKKIKAKKNSLNDPFVQLYEKTNIIVTMRETTAMHITGHLRDRMHNVMDHFDLSQDVDKTEIMERRISLARNLIREGEILNAPFCDAIEQFEKLINDRMFMRTIFQLFNNDYRTTSLCFSTICIEHIEDVKMAIEVMKSKSAMIISGGRGIIYRLLFESFYTWGYFKGMGIPSRKTTEGLSLKGKDGNYSYARVILTILCNKQAKIPERFFVNPEESVDIMELLFMLPQSMQSENCIDILDSLYTLRNKHFWNHLITFDNLVEYSKKGIENYVHNQINGSSHSSEDSIYIRATSAGQTFVDIICVHYEFFACRFSMNTPHSLFQYYELDDDSQVKIIQQIMEDVYRAVEKCVENLESYNKEILSIKHSSNYSEIVTSPYYFESQFHEERIIHAHISYLEGYRHFIALKSSPNGYSNGNSLILRTIKRYLGLLRYNPNNGIKEFRDRFISPNSKKLYNELSVCIEAIEETPSLSRVITITREYYRKNYNGKLCKLFERG